MVHNFLSLAEIVPRHAQHKIAFIAQQIASNAARDTDLGAPLPHSHAEVSSRTVGKGIFSGLSLFILFLLSSHRPSPRIFIWYLFASLVPLVVECTLFFES